MEESVLSPKPKTPGLNMMGGGYVHTFHIQMKDFWYLVSPTEEVFFYIFLAVHR